MEILKNEIEVFIPGRLCILGEHSDWAGEYRNINKSVSYGMAVVCTTNEGLYATCNKWLSNQFKFQCKGEENNNNYILECNLNENELMNIASEGSFFSYVAGTMLAILKNQEWANLLKETGIFINNYKTTLPMKKGLSSSAAVCVLVVQSFSDLFQLHLDVRQIMELAYEGEMNTPSRCGRMDQCVAMGKDSIGLMEFNESNCSLHKLSSPVPIYFVVADMKAGKDTVVILKSLNECFPEPLSSQQFSMHLYSHKNQDLAWKAVIAITTGDIQLLAQTMTKSQKLFNESAIHNCPSELTAPRLNSTLQDPSLKPYYLAAKGVGSQGDGSVQFLCESYEQQQQLLNILTSNPWNYEAFSLTIAPTTQLHSNNELESFVIKNRVFSALIFCDTMCNLDNIHTVRTSIIGYLLELIACGIRQIILICSGGCNQILCDHITTSTLSSISYDNNNDNDNNNSNSMIHEWTYFQAKHSILLDHLLFRKVDSQNHDSKRIIIGEAINDIYKYSQDNYSSIKSVPLMVGYLRNNNNSELSSNTSKIYDILFNASSPSSSSSSSSSSLNVDQEYLISIENNLKVDTLLLTLTKNQENQDSSFDETISYLMEKLNK